MCVAPPSWDPLGAWYPSERVTKIGTARLFIFLFFGQWKCKSLRTVPYQTELHLPVETRLWCYCVSVTLLSLLPACGFGSCYYLYSNVLGGREKLLTFSVAAHFLLLLFSFFWSCFKIASLQRQILLKNNTFATGEQRRNTLKHKNNKITLGVFLRDNFLVGTFSSSCGCQVIYRKPSTT